MPRVLPELDAVRMLGNVRWQSTRADNATTKHTMATGQRATTKRNVYVYGLMVPLYVVARLLWLVGNIFLLLANIFLELRDLIIDYEEWSFDLPSSRDK